MKTFNTILTIVACSVLLVLAYSQFSNCFGWHTDEVGTTEYLSRKGYTNITFLPFSITSACPKEVNWVRTRFSATKDNKPMSGCLCGGLLDDGKILVEY